MRNPGTGQAAPTGAAAGPASQGAAWPDDGSVWPSEGLPWPGDGTSWPADGRVWPDHDTRAWAKHPGPATDTSAWAPAPAASRYRYGQSHRDGSQALNEDQIRFAERYQDARLYPEDARSAQEEPGHFPAENLALACYLGAALVGFLLPLAVHLTAGRSSPRLRWHSAQALNVALTSLIWALSIVIVGGLLALDSATLGFGVGIAGLVALWLASAAYLVRAALAAEKGTRYQVPGWLRASFARQGKEERGIRAATRIR